MRDSARKTVFWAGLCLLSVASAEEIGKVDTKLRPLSPDDSIKIESVQDPDAFKPGEHVFRERRSLIFKSLRVIRFCDVQHNAIVYLVYSEKLIDGSPKNSVAAVPIKLWPGQETPLAHCTYAK